MDDQKKYARLFNDIDSQALITVGLVLLSAIVLIIVSQRGLNWLASRLHGQVRFRIFALVPLTRLPGRPTSAISVYYRPNCARQDCAQCGRRPVSIVTTWMLPWMPATLRSQRIDWLTNA
ncbi:MAG: hypothetical protein ACTH5D_13185 [Halomonas sp.]|uniref:hypothetical protein n=1 Tax=Halomonas sp. TaxID=1486246 RepID=UPI003F929BB8